VVFVILSITFLVLSAYDQFIVYEVDSVVAFIIAALLLFRDPKTRVPSVVLDAAQLSSSQAIAELASDEGGYTYLPLGESVEDVFVVPSRSVTRAPSAGELRSAIGKITPPGRTLALLFLRESGLTGATMDGLANSLPRIIPETFGLADFMSIRSQGDSLNFTLGGASRLCTPKPVEASRKSGGVVGCTVASFLAVLYSSASKRPVVLEDCFHDEANGTWSIRLNIQRVMPGVT